MASGVGVSLATKKIERRFLYDQDLVAIVTVQLVEVWCILKTTLLTSTPCAWVWTGYATCWSCTISGLLWNAAAYVAQVRALGHS